MRRSLALSALLCVLLTQTSVAQELAEDIAISGTVGTLATNEQGETVERRIIDVIVIVRRESDKRRIARTTTKEQGRFFFTKDDVPDLGDSIILEFIPPDGERVRADSLTMLSTEDAREMELNLQNIRKVLSEGPGSSKKYKGSPKSTEKKELDSEFNQRMSRQIDALLEFERIYSRQIVSGETTPDDEKMLSHIKKYLSEMPDVIDEMPTDHCGYKIMFGDSNIRSIYRTKRSQVRRLLGVANKRCDPISCVTRTAFCGNPRCGCRAMSYSRTSCGGRVYVHRGGWMICR